MKFGFVLPYGDARTAAECAYQAEQAGWDGFFVWEPVWGIDAWVCLAAAAMRTTHIRLGTLLSPLSRMRPWKLASESATLDHLSGGRVILSVGLGALDTGFAEFGEVTDRKMRAELMDEGLEILTGLWQGQPFNYTGKHYQVKQVNFYPPPPPIQQPRIPIWVVGAWPFHTSLARALRYDGLLPAKIDPVTRKWQEMTLADLRQISAFIADQRTAAGPYEIIWEGKTPGDDPDRAAEIVYPWAEAGATWWIEAMWGADSIGPALTRIQQGPPA
jgi:alkanesulfonate monooxygenase SsuD/methylene tetrahydromethanopterin reductase-like flavin-dependent oxidoreductase (luciferase family)